MCATFSCDFFSGAELAELMTFGTKVVRGRDWKWEDQDGGPNGEGVIVGKVEHDGWVRVKWASGATNSYRMGKLDKYDLQLAPSERNRLDLDCGADDDEDAGVATNESEYKAGKSSRESWATDARGNVCQDLMPTAVSHVINTFLQVSGL